MPSSRTWPPFFWISYAMCVGVMGTALASPLYPLYQAAWNRRPSDITHVFVVYMFGVLAILLFMGRLVIGMASGMISTSAATGLVQVSEGRDPRRVSALTTMAMTLGFAMGPLVGGLIAQWLPHPLVTAYLPSALMGMLAVYALLQVREPQRAAPPVSAGGGFRAALAQWLPSISLPPPAARRHFAIASLGAFSAFGMFSLYASLAPRFMSELVPWHGPAVSGGTIAAILFLASAFQFRSGMPAGRGKLWRAGGRPGQ